MAVQAATRNMIRPSTRAYSRPSNFYTAPRIENFGGRNFVLLEQLAGANVFGNVNNARVITSFFDAQGARQSVVRLMNRSDLLNAGRSSNIEIPAATKRIDVAVQNAKGRQLALYQFTMDRFPVRGEQPILPDGAPSAHNLKITPRVESAGPQHFEMTLGKNRFVAEQSGEGYDISIVTRSGSMPLFHVATGADVWQKVNGSMQRVHMTAAERVQAIFHRIEAIGALANGRNGIRLRDIHFDSSYLQGDRDIHHYWTVRIGDKPLFTFLNGDKGLVTDAASLDGNQGGSRTVARVLDAIRSAVVSHRSDAPNALAAAPIDREGFISSYIKHNLINLGLGITSEQANGKVVIRISTKSGDTIQTITGATNTEALRKLSRFMQQMTDEMARSVDRELRKKLASEGRLNALTYVDLDKMLAGDLQGAIKSAVVDYAREQGSSALGKSLLAFAQNILQNVPGYVQRALNYARGLIGVPYRYGATPAAGLKGRPTALDCSSFIQLIFNRAGAGGIRRVADQQYFDPRAQRVLSAHSDGSCPHPNAKSHHCECRLVSVTSAASIRTKIMGQLKPGDLIVFYNASELGIGHIGVYAGDGKFFHAGSSTGVTEANLTNPYWLSRIIGAARLPAGL